MKLFREAIQGWGALGLPLRGKGLQAGRYVQRGAAPGCLCWRRDPAFLCTEGWRGDSGSPLACRPAPPSPKPSLPTLFPHQRMTRNRATPGGGDQEPRRESSPYRPTTLRRPALRCPWSLGSAMRPPGPLHLSGEGACEASVPTWPGHLLARGWELVPGRAEDDASGRCPFLLPRPFSLPAWIPALPEFLAPFSQVSVCLKWVG